MKLQWKSDTSGSIGDGDRDIRRNATVRHRHDSRLMFQNLIARFLSLLLSISPPVLLGSCEEQHKQEQSREEHAHKGKPAGMRNTRKGENRVHQEAKGKADEEDCSPERLAWLHHFSGFLNSKKIATTKLNSPVPMKKPAPSMRRYVRLKETPINAKPAKAKRRAKRFWAVRLNLHSPLGLRLV